MNAIVFTGPTISAEEARDELDATYLPPVSQGDVYRALQRKPRIIGIVDGYFERVPAVWHKEILWAMTRGVHVFGSASMGALRAAELQAFGMEGVGAIYEAYRDGTLADDDEVAVAHGHPEDGYRGQSDAMVNIRATLQCARQERVISEETQARLERIAKDLFYPDRSYLRMLQRAAREGIAETELAALARWLPDGRVDQKRQDAIAMLRLIRSRLERGIAPKRVRFSFEHTVYWEDARLEAERAMPEADPETQTPDGFSLLDELRLEGRYAQAHQASMGRLLAVEDAERRGARISPEMVQEAGDAFRREHGLLTPEAASHWRDENHLDEEELHRFLEEEALQRWSAGRMRHDVSARMPNYLRSSGDYSRLAARARDKRRVLASNDLDMPSLQAAGLTEEELYHWYFEHCLGRNIAPDIASFARHAGFRDVDSFRRAVLREYLYRTQLQTND